MKPDQQPQLPFSREPINWLEPVAFKFNQLRDVADAAARAGFRIVRLKVIAGGYEAQFQREAAGDAIAAMLAVTRRTFQPDAENAASAKPSDFAAFM